MNSRKMGQDMINNRGELNCLWACSGDILIEDIILV